MHNLTKTGERLTKGLLKRASLTTGCSHSAATASLVLPHLLKLSHAGVHRLHGSQPEEGEWGPQQAEHHQPQRGEPGQGQVPHRGHHRPQFRLFYSTPHLPEGVHRQTHGHEVQVCESQLGVCVCVKSPTEKHFY